MSKVTQEDHRQQREGFTVGALLFVILLCLNLVFSAMGQVVVHARTSERNKDAYTGGGEDEQGREHAFLVRQEEVPKRFNGVALFLNTTNARAMVRVSCRTQ